MTTHSIIRAKERVGLSEEKARKTIDEAFRKGKRSNEYSAKQRKYLNNIERNGCIPIIYKNFCFIFSEEGSRCITVYPIPHWFNEKTFFYNKNRIRNPKRYFCRYINY